MRLLLIILLVLILGCKGDRSGEEKKHISKKTGVDIQNIKYPSDITYEYMGADSLELDSLLQTALHIANENKNETSLNGEIFKANTKDKKLFATYQFGRLFSNKKHLLIKRVFQRQSANTDLYSDIYFLTGNKLVHVVSDTAETGYWQDSLLDVNFDGYKDYMISSYSGAGCCPRDAKTVYLYDTKTGRFAKESLFNPEPDPLNKIVYETDYGSPGLISFYKYKWVGRQKIKLESISPNRYSIDSFVEPYSFIKMVYPSESKYILKDVPGEYKQLKLFDYFISYQR